MDQCKLPLAEAYLQPSDLGTVFIGRILATTKEKYSSFDMIYWFTVKDNAQFEDIKRRIYWELPRVTDNGMQRLIINYSLE